MVAEITAHVRSINGLSLHPDRNVVASCGEDQYLHVWSFYDFMDVGRFDEYFHSTYTCYYDEHLNSDALYYIALMVLILYKHSEHVVLMYCHSHITVLVIWAFAYYSEKN